MSETNLIIATSRSESSLPVIELGGVRKDRPLAMYFVYSPKGNFLIKGNADLVRDYVDKEFPVCIYRYTFWEKGISRGNWRGNGLFVHHLATMRTLVYNDAKRRKQFPGVEWYNDSSLVWYKKTFLNNASHSAKYAITNMKVDGSKVFFYRQMPKKWLLEWNELVLPERETVSPVLNNPNFFI